ncbi:hypothetical protein PQR33_36125 [Paraburkholderia sediminicola]|uniref:hypothetical protein n=1 Tax=Paraburkholderia sediminicola TaxID=458836 RepID=UPI0038BA533C
MIGKFMRAAMKRGWVIVMIGPSGTGKTFMLERTIPGKIIDKSALAMKGADKVAFDLSEVPADRFAIDEPMVFDGASLRAGIATLRGRGFAMAFQQSRTIDILGLTEELLTHHKCIALFVNGRRGNSLWWTNSEYWQ